MMSRFLKLFGLFVFATTSCLTASPPCVKDLKDIAEQCTFRVRYEEDFCVDPFQAQPRGALLTLDAREFFDDPDGTIFVEWNARGLDKEGGFPKIKATSEDTIESVFLAMRALADTKYGSDSRLKVFYSLYMRASPLPFENVAHRDSLCETWPRRGMIHVSHSDRTRLHRDQSIFENDVSSIPVTLELENFGVIPHPTPFGEVLSNPLIEKIILKKTRIPFFALGSSNECPVMCQIAGTHGQGWQDYFSKHVGDKATYQAAQKLYQNEEGESSKYPIAFFEEQQNPWKLDYPESYDVVIHHQPFPFLPCLSPIYNSKLAYPHTLIAEVDSLGQSQEGKLVGLLTCLKQLSDRKDLKDGNWHCVRPRFKQAQLPMDGDVEAHGLLSPAYLGTLCAPSSLSLYFEGENGDVVETHAFNERISVEEYKLGSEVKLFDKIYTWYVHWETAPASSSKKSTPPRTSSDPTPGPADGMSFTSAVHSEEEGDSQDAYSMTFGPVYTATIQGDNNAYYSTKMPGPHTFHLLLSNIAQHMFRQEMDALRVQIERKAAEVWSEQNEASQNDDSFLSDNWGLSSNV